MRPILVSIALVIAALGVSLVRAQENTGPVAEKARQAVINIETHKVEGAVGKDNAGEGADWFDRVDDDGMIMVGADGLLETKAEHEARIRSAEVAIVSMRQYDHRARVFLDGKVVVLTYKQSAQMKGEKDVRDGVGEDIWINKDGKWLRISHSTHRIDKKK